MEFRLREVTSLSSDCPAKGGEIQVFRTILLFPPPRFRSARNPVFRCRAERCPRVGYREDPLNALQFRAPGCDDPRCTEASNGASARSDGKPDALPLPSASSARREQYRLTSHRIRSTHRERGSSATPPFHPARGSRISSRPRYMRANGSVRASGLKIRSRSADDLVRCAGRPAMPSTRKHMESRQATPQDENEPAVTARRPRKRSTRELQTQHRSNRRLPERDSRYRRAQLSPLLREQSAP